MTISIGERVPKAVLKTNDGDGPRDISTDQIFSNRKVVLFGVPGAFTPTCSLNHLPGFIEHGEEFKAKGVDEIAVVAVNDHHVMNAWAKATGGEGKILYLADGNGDFIKALGLDVDLAVAGLGRRSRRFSMMVEDGVVKILNVEDSPGQAETSSASALIATL